jgi:hypothetical protein
MQTLSYGYKLPEDGDKGSVFFPALEDNVTRVNSHNHDGSNSALLTATSIASAQVTITGGTWTTVTANALYSKLVTVPSGFNMDDYTITTRISGGDLVYPTIVRSSSTTFTIYTNDSSLTYVVTFR